MVMTDPIADMLTRIRNANRMRHKNVLIPLSKVKKDILECLLTEGFIKSYNIEKTENNHENLNVELRYTDDNQRVIKGLKRISKPGLRVYAKVDELPKVFNGLGIAIISTSKGIMTDRQARQEKIGGEVFAYVW